jgi:3-oxoacyl-[acyl-carrier protein] reductase
VIAFGEAYNVTINNVLPGMYLTDRLKGTISTWAKNEGVGVEEAAAMREKTIPAKRFGDPAEFGDLCAFYCSAQAGYMTGQNLLTDGGHYPGTL